MVEIGEGEFEKCFIVFYCEFYDGFKCVDIKVMFSFNQIKVVYDDLVKIVGDIKDEFFFIDG